MMRRRGHATRWCVLLDHLIKRTVDAIFSFAIGLYFQLT